MKAAILDLISFLNDLFIYIVVKSLLSVYSSTNKKGLSNVCQKLEVRFTSCKYFKVIQKYFESILSFCKPLKEIAAL